MRPGPSLFMRPDQVNAWVSEARFRSFLAACGRDHDVAVALYRWNAEVSGSLLEVMHHVEVLLRNAIDRQFPATPPNERISICLPSVWLTDPAIVEDRGRERVNDAIERLTHNESRETRDRVVAALSFGFWGALFTGRYDDLWRTHLYRAFPNGDGRRKQVNSLVQRIGRVRNRVAHHEAIFDFKLEEEHDRLLNLAGLIDDEAREFVSELSRVPAVVLNDPRR